MTLFAARFDLAQGAQAKRALKLILDNRGFCFSSSQGVRSDELRKEILPVVVILAALVLAALVIQTRFQELALNHGTHHWDILQSETDIFSRTIKVVAIVVLLAGTARAQVIPGDSPNMGIGSAVSGSRGLGIVSRPHTWEGYKSQRSERNYNETVKRSPDKKPSSDPWKNVRQAPTAADRHQPQ